MRLAVPVGIAAAVAGMLVAGRVDGPAAAALGGLATGAVLGAGQALASRHRLPLLRWLTATALGMGASGAVTVTALLGILLQLVLPAGRAEPLRIIGDPS